MNLRSIVDRAFYSERVTLRCSPEAKLGRISISRKQRGQGTLGADADKATDDAPKPLSQELLRQNLTRSGDGGFP